MNYINDLVSQTVVAINGEARASTEVIASGVKQQHASVMKLLRKHKDSFESFGEIRFEIRLNKQGKSTEYAMLNEHQSGLLIAFMRNTPRVIDFKVKLISDFFKLRDELQRSKNDLWQQMQALIAREVESKVKASFGSHLMLQRKREIPKFRDEYERIGHEIQPSLLLN